jgi:hypothetical protein
MRGHPELPAHAQKFHESWWVSRWGKDGRQGEIFVFANGSFVCWGLEEDEAHRFALEVIGRVPGIEVSPLKVSLSSLLDRPITINSGFIGPRNRRIRIRRGSH